MKSIHTKLKTDGFESWFFPSGESDRCVITLVDSEGNNIVNKALARWFGKHGCCSLGLGKWQDHTQRDGLHEWPLEYFGKAIDWLKTRGIKKNQRLWNFLRRQYGIVGCFPVSGHYANRCL